MQMIDIDGSYGEGGGQVLRSALTLSLITGTPFRITKIRAGRGRPGLLRQHLTCVKAACEISGAAAMGAELGSTSLEFRPPGPSAARAGSYAFAVGSAGSTSLVLATIMLPLLLSSGESQVRLEGGTHNPSAPPFEFLSDVLIPRLRELGFVLDAKLERAGFFPAGGGVLTVTLGTSAAPAPLRHGSWLTRGETVLTGNVLVANLTDRIGGRELVALAEALGIERRDVRIENVRSRGPGNAVMARATSSDGVCELVTAFGERGKTAEAVAEEAASLMKTYLASPAPVGEHLADQLLLPLALGRGGEFVTHAKSMHLTTNAWVLERFLGNKVTFEDENGTTRVHVTAP
jgi:RNA 3'-terminal phosphate cyclase (ATP)